jgi:hypothetical protein
MSDSIFPMYHLACSCDFTDNAAKARKKIYNMRVLKWIAVNGFYGKVKVGQLS